MNVELLTSTKDAFETVAKVATLCYGKDEPSAKRVEACYRNGHTSIFEHASATFLADGPSRAMTHQLVRHRIASYTQRSQRYCDEYDSLIVIPESIAREPDALSVFLNSAIESKRAYRKLLGLGIKKEDARYCLQEATETKVAMTMNFRSLYHLWDLRISKGAQWEIREFAEKTLELCLEDENLRRLAELWSPQE